MKMFNQNDTYKIVEHSLGWSIVVDGREAGTFQRTRAHALQALGIHLIRQAGKSLPRPGLEDDFPVIEDEGEVADDDEII